MATVNITKTEANGFVVTGAFVEVAGNSKAEALMRALTAIDREANKLAVIFSVETYTVSLVEGSSIRYIVTVS